MGRVAGAYGVRGWIKVAPRHGGAQGLAEAGEWWIDGTPHSVSEARIHGATVVARLAGLEQREQAMALRGKTVAVRREALPDPEPGRYYLGDLVGLALVNEAGERLGVVESFFSNGAHDVAVAVDGSRKRLLPWVAAVVKEVDLEAGLARVSWGADW